MREIFADWTDDHFERFDTLGVGSGGYGPYKDKSFFVMMRIIVNGFEDTQSRVPLRSYHTDLLPTVQFLVRSLQLAA